MWLLLLWLLLLLLPLVGLGQSLGARPPRHLGSVGVEVLLLVLGLGCGRCVLGREERGGVVGSAVGDGARERVRGVVVRVRGVEGGGEP